MKALLLCAGQALRFRPYSLTYSKMVIPFLNIPIVSYPLKLLEDIRVTDLVINTHQHAQQVEHTIKKLNADIKNIHFSHEPQLLGGARSLKKNQTLLEGEDLIYLNGDSVFLCDDFFEDMKRQHQSKNALITFLVTPQPPSEKTSLWADKEHRAYYSNSSPSSACRPYFFTGLALISSECFSFIKETDKEFFKDFFTRLPKRCFVFLKENLDFFEVGSLPYYLRSTEKCLKYLSDPYQKNHHQILKNTLLRFDPSFHFYQDKKNEAYVLHGQDVEGLNNVEFQNFSVIGEGCRFSSKTLIKEAVLGPRVFSHEKQWIQTLKLASPSLV